MIRSPSVWHSPELTSICAERAIRYCVHRCQSRIFDLDNTKLAKVLDGRPSFIVADERVANLYADQWSAYSSRHLSLLGQLSLRFGEHVKSLATVEHICDVAHLMGLPRNGVFIAIGGGITMDTVGLAAAIYRRGIGYVRIPTTLVGLCDAGVGIKQAVNAFGKKNLLGAFYPPIASINDYRFLATLPRSEIAAGMTEVAKIALVRDPTLFDLLETHASELLGSQFQFPRAVAEDIAVRAELMMMEELAPNLFEEQLARLVDFGHTFSPAIESQSKYEIHHGNAVALDIMLSVAISVGRGYAVIGLLRRLVTFFDRIGFGTNDPRMCGADRLCQALEQARQHRGGSLNLVVLRDVGSPAFLDSVTADEISSALHLMHVLERPTILRPSERTPHLVRSAG